MIALLKQRDFRLAWFGGLISLTGDWVLFIALPLYVYELTGSTLATSGIFLARLVPAIALGSIAGAFVDRWDRKRTLVIANLLQMVVVLPLLTVDSAAMVPVVFGVAFVQSVLGRFTGPAENALLPRLVTNDQLLTANALNALNNNLARLIGPALGGVVMAWAGLRASVLLDALSYGAAALLIGAISVSARAERSDAPEEEARSIWREWRDGLRLIRRRRAVATLISLESIGFLGEGVMSVMFVVWVSEVIGGGAQELGWLMSGQAVGGIAGGIVLAAVSHRLSPIRLYGFAGMIFGLLDLCLFNYPRVIEGVWLGVVIIGIAGLPVVAYDTGITTLLQHTVEDLYRGRVFGVMGTLGASLQLVGTLLAGLLGGLLGPLTLLNIQGGSYVLVGVLALVLLPRTMAGEEQAPAVRESAGAMGEETSS